METVAVIGAGNVGLAIAGHMALNGHDVRLYDPWGEPLVAVEANRGVDLTGEVEGRGLPQVLTSDLSTAVRGAEIIVVAAPAFSHKDLAHHLAPLLKPQQITLFQPGALGSSIHLLQQFAELGRTPCFVAETPTSLYTCRKKSSTTVYIGAIKHSVRIAALPNDTTGHCVDILNGYFDNRYAAGENALTVGLNNANPIYHVPPSVLNFKTVEDSKEHPLHSLVTPRIAHVVDLMDRERLSVADALGVTCMSFWDFLETAYGVRDGDFQARIVQAYGKQAFPEPDSPQHRYFTEDIPFGMVPWLSLARELGVSVPIIEALTTLGSALCQQNFTSTGRTMESLGLHGAGREGIRKAFIEGTVR